MFHVQSQAAGTARDFLTIIDHRSVNGLTDQGTSSSFLI